MAAKRPNPNPKSQTPGTSPAQTSALGKLTSQESEKSDKEWQTTMQNLLSTGFDQINRRLTEMTNQMTYIQAELTETKEQVTQIKTKTQDIEGKMKNTDARLDKAEESVQQIQRDQRQCQDRLIMLEMERALKMLRIQNVPEKGSEDLETVMSEALAPAIEMDVAEFRQGLEAAFRVSTAYVRKNNLPKEVHLRFTKKAIRDKVLRASQEKQLIIEDKKINVLKQIPWQVRQRRKEYASLAQLLQQNGISYRWLTPEGLFFRIDTQRYNITSPMKAQNFIEKMRKKLKKTDNKESEERSREEQSQLG
uniref:LINE-1 type transposase domain-containing protein 1 n=1 Tax=Pogona vitticeps TaxID=103695 RepID=A0ABM5G0I9_9SAUR